MHEVVSASSYLTPSWAVAPFVGYLFLIAALPLFAGRLCFSVPLWREDNLLVKQVSAFLVNAADLKSFLYLSVGEKETENIQGGLDAIALVLKSHAPSGLVWHAERTPGVDHQTNAAVSGWNALTKWGAYLRR